MARPARDTITISKEGGGDASLLIDRSTQFEIVTDLLAPSTARFELGDEGTWDALRDIGAIGSRMVVSINGYTRLKGRLLTRNLMATVGGGATVQLAIRTRLADAMFTACDPGVGVKNVQLKDLILQAFKRMGLEEADFIFQGDVARSVLTGRGSRNAPEPEVRSLTRGGGAPAPARDHLRLRRSPPLALRPDDVGRARRADHHRPPRRRPARDLLDDRAARRAELPHE
jgi:hypothetical protein